MTRARRGLVGGQRGFTLIELMIALVVSSLLVGMILAIFNRMSISYRGQQQIAGVQQVLAAARATIETDAKQAGLEMAQGFKLGGEASAPIHQPVLWTDSAIGPDSINFYYADLSLQAVVTGVVGLAVTVDANPGFVAGSLISLVNVDTSGSAITSLGSDPTIAKFDACVTKVLSVAGNVLQLTTTLPWGKPGSTNCTIGAGTMVYGFVAHAYKIDTTNDPTITAGPMFPSARGTLQMSSTGNLLGAAEVWNDLAFGFTDIQIAMRYYDNDATDQDADGDATRDWYSGALGAGLTATSIPGPGPGPGQYPIRMSISLVARTDRDMEGISTSQTPNLVGTPVDYNAIGNHPLVALPAQAPWVADPLLKGSRVYRYVTFQVDLRNMGVGR